MKSMIVQLLAALAIGVLANSSQAQASLPQYRLTVLAALEDPPIPTPIPPGGFSGIDSWANDINSTGHVVGGTHDIRLPSNVATFWINGSPTGLGRFSDISGRSDSNSEAVAINDAGTIVVNVQGMAFGSGSGVVTVHNGQRTLIGDGFASSINSSGVVGGSSLATRRATLWVDSQTIDLGTIGGSSSWVQALNNTGLSVGGSTLAGDPTYQCMPSPQSAKCYVTRAMIWQASGAPIVLGTMDGMASRSIAVNDSGHVVGEIKYAEGRPSHSFVWDGAGMIDTGEVYLSDINNLGVMVGATGAPFTNLGVAAMWLDGQSVDLNSLLDAESSKLGWQLRYAKSINDAGQIIVYGQNNAVFGGGYLVLTPVDEPQPLALLLSGLVTISLFRRRLVVRRRPRHA